MLADSYPFWSLMGTMLVFFVWILFFWLLFGVFADIFSRHDLSGWAKTGWVIFVVILPFLGIFIYLISQSDGMRERSLARQGPQPAYQGAARVEAPRRRSSRARSCWTAARSPRRSSMRSSRRRSPKAYSQRLSAKLRPGESRLGRSSMSRSYDSCSSRLCMTAPISSATPG